MKDEKSFVLIQMLLAGRLIGPDRMLRGVKKGVDSRIGNYLGIVASIMQ